MTFGKKALGFIEGLKLEIELPEKVEVMNPFLETETKRIAGEFYSRYYNDSANRIFMFGINPGRYGAGITGVNFTDPIRLETALGIQNNFPKKQELSSVLIYEIIEAFGGVGAFYSQFYISAISPLGFTKEGLNLNYYDDRNLQNALKSFIVDCIKKQLEFGAEREICFCIGEGKNFDFFEKLNKEYSFFGEIIPLPHPRFIMQYKQRRRAEYINLYVQALRQASYR